MASPGGSIIGRVSVKVLPDTSDFRDELKDDLRKKLTGLDLKVKVELDAEHLKASLDKVRREVERWRDQHDPLELGVEVDMAPGQTAAVSARLAWLTRARTTTIVPVINPGAYSSVMTALAALSGGRVLKDLFENLKDVYKEFDRLVPKIGTFALALGGLTQWLLAGTSNIAALTLSLAQMFTATLAMPGLFAGMGVGIGVFVVALTTLKDQLPELMDLFSQMREQIGKNFWDEAGKGALALAEQYLPLVSTTASRLGEFFGSLGTQLAEVFGGALPGMFKNLDESINIATANTGVFASIITTLGTAGSEYLPRLSTWVGDLATKFDAFLTRTSESGELTTFIESGLQGFKDLGNVLLTTAQIIGDIGKAAQAGGGSTLGILADTLDRIREVTESEAFQSTLTSVFETAHATMSTIADKSGPAVKELFSALADTLVALGPAIGEGLGTAIGAIATALANPALQAGISSVFGAMVIAIQALEPAMMPLSDALAALAPIISALLGVIAPLVTAAMIPFSQAVQELAPALVPVIQELGGSLLGAVTTLSPVMLKLVDAFISILPAITPMLPAIAAGGLAFKALGLVSSNLQGQLARLVAYAIRWAIQMAAQWVVAMGPVGWVIAIVVGLVALIIANWDKIKAWTIKAWTAIKDWIINAAKSVVNWIKNNWQNILAFLTGPIGIAVALIVKHWDKIKAVFKAGVDKVKDFVQGIPDKVKSAFSNAGQWLQDAGRRIIQGLIDGIAGMFNSVRNKLGELTSKLTSWKGPESVDKVLLYDAGQLVIDGFIKGLESRYDAVRRSLGGLSNDVADFTVAAPGVGNVSGLVDGAMSTNPVGASKVFNYYAAPGSSLGSEEDLFAAASRARMVGW